MFAPGRITRPSFELAAVFQITRLGPVDDLATDGCLVGTP
jgi:hypothetical protein